MRFTCACATFLALGLGAGGARAQDASEPTSTDTPAQLWFNVTPGWMKGERWYWELDLEPKWQVSNGEQWRNFDVTPLSSTTRPTGSISRPRERLGDPASETASTRSRSPSASACGSACSAKWCPTARGSLVSSTSGCLSRAWRSRRSCDWSGATSTTRTTPPPSTRGVPGRASRASSPSTTGSFPRTGRSTIADVEYYAPIGSDIPEKYVNKLRARLGAGYRFSAAKKLEILYIRDWNRDSTEADAKQDAQALDFRVKLLI